MLNTTGMKPLTRHEFFYVEEDNYDEHCSYSIPFYREMHAELVAMAGGNTENPRLLDLGCGTGTTTRELLDQYPDASVSCIDLFEEMLNHARGKLAAYGDQVSYICGDFRTITLPAPTDICVTSLALHHILPDEKKRLFEKIFKCLRPGGKFLMLDWSRFENKTVQERAYQQAADHVRQSGASRKTTEDWIYHWKHLNIPDTVEDMNSWLKQAGFKHAECVIRNYGICLLMAEK
jgi:tRNA (cmo5U34)-methyltransferase